MCVCVVHTLSVSKKDYILYDLRHFNHVLGFCAGAFELCIGQTMLLHGILSRSNSHARLYIIPCKREEGRLTVVDGKKIDLHKFQ